MKISFVVPSFNSVTWLPQAVASVLEQTYRDIECVIVDDGSTDETGEYLGWIEKQDSRVKVVRLESNQGRSKARNIGNANASGSVICVLDADDLALPNRAKITAEKFEKGCEFLYGSAVGIDACGRNLGEIRADVFNREKAIETMENRIVHSSCAYTTALSLRFPYEDGEVSRLGVDDWALQIRAAVSGVRLDFVTNILSAYRVLSSAVSQTRNADEVKKFKETYLEGLKTVTA